MTLLITGYVALVVLSVYFIQKFKNDAFEANCKTKNYQKWLAQAEDNQWNARQELAVAYKVIDRMQDERDGTSFADEVSSVIDEPFVRVQTAGTYFDGDGMPQIDRMDWSSQDGVSYSESDDTDV